MNIVHSRRRALAAMASTLAATALSRAEAPHAATVEKPATDAHKSLTAIHYEIDFKPSPRQLYEAILDQKQFAAFSGLPATIDPTAGGAFSMFGGVIVGRTIELVFNQRIVQAWRPNHWDPGVYSIVHFEFKPRAEETTLIFDHTGFPAGDYDSLDSGWHSRYWEPLKRFFA